MRRKKFYNPLTLRIIAPGEKTMSFSLFHTKNNHFCHFAQKLGPMPFPHPPGYFSLDPDSLTQLSIGSDHPYMISKNHDFPLPQKS